MTSTATNDRAQWLEARQAGIGGSDAGVVAGLSPYKSAYQLFLEKSGQIDASQDETDAMYWGTVLEEPIARRYSEVTGKRVRRQPMRSCLQNTFMLANIDRQITGDSRGPGILEVKTTNAFKRVDGLDELPDHYYLQLQHYLAVTGYEWGAFAFLIGGQSFRHFEVTRDQPTIDMLIEIEREFWRRVELGDPPPVDGSDATRALLSHMYPNDTGEVVTLGMRDVFIDLVNARRHIATYEQLKQEFENLIKSEMGDASVAMIPGAGKCSWKRSRDGEKIEFDFTRLRIENPTLYSQLNIDGYITTKTIPGSRRFLVTPDKEHSK